MRKRNSKQTFNRKIAGTFAPVTKKAVEVYESAEKLEEVFQQYTSENVTPTQLAFEITQPASEITQKQPHARLFI